MTTVRCVAGFIGSPAMNFVKGTINGAGFQPAGGFTLPIAGAPAGSSGMPAVYGLRPKAIRLDGAGIEARVHVVEPMGSDTQVVADIAGHNITCVFRERIQVKPGEMIRITPDAKLTHLFDENSGKRLAA
jgi:multiple sugar transport system ATP-binding protein